MTGRTFHPRQAGLRWQIPPRFSSALVHSPYGKPLHPSLSGRGPPSVLRPLANPLVFKYCIFEIPNASASTTAFAHMSTDAHSIPYSSAMSRHAFCTTSSSSSSTRSLMLMMMMLMRRAISQTHGSRKESLTCNNKICEQIQLFVATLFRKHVESVCRLVHSPHSPLSPVSRQESSEDGSKSLNCHSFRLREARSKIRKLAQSHCSRLPVVSWKESSEVRFFKTKLSPLPKVEVLSESRFEESSS